MENLASLRLVRNSILSFSLVLGFSAGAKEMSPESKAALARLTEGPPAIQAQLTPESFVTFTHEKLSNAQAWYVDYEYFRKMGVEVPPEGLKDPDFQKAIVDALGWQARGAHDEDRAFTGDKKTRYTDYYGGYGMGGNLGSGRAGINGMLQAKGEITPLAKSSDPFHSNGAVQSIEAVDEAIWSKVLDAELSMGSNKVVAVILTGTYAQNKGGNFFPRALIVREMALRPAHFMINDSRPSHLETARVKALMPQLLNALPYPSSGRPKSDTEALKVGVMHLVDLEAKAEAEYFAKRMFFGSVSPSNLEITGRRLDLGDHTSNPGFTKIYRLDWQHETPFGEIKEFLNLFAAFRNSLAKTLPFKLNFALPSVQDIQARFVKTYSETRAREMVMLTGVPREVVSSLEKTESLRKLGDILVTVARAGNTETVFMDHAGWENKGTYDLGAILTRLAENPSEALAANQELLSDLMKDDSKLRGGLAKAYATFLVEARAEAARAGVTSSALATYMKEAVKLRNADRPELVRGDRRWRTLWDTTDKAINERNPSIVENYIAEQTSKAIFNFKDAAPYQLVLKEEKNAAEGVSKRRVFDARQNLESTVVRVSVAGGKANFRGRVVPASEVQRLLMEVRPVSGGASIVAKGRQAGDWVEFSFDGLKELDLKTAKIVTIRGRTEGSPTVTVPNTASRSRAAASCKALF